MHWSFFRSLLALIATVTVLGAPANAEPILHHVHGMAFTPDGKALVVPAHTGLAVYRDGRWNLARGRNTTSWGSRSQTRRFIPAVIRHPVRPCATRSA